MIKFVFRWAFRLVLLALVLGIGLLLLKDNIARSVTEERLRQETGFDVKIGKMEMSLFAPRVRLENVVLYNPAEYGGSVFLDIPDLHIEYEREKLALGKVRLKLLRLDVREFHIVENQQGRTNLIDILYKAAPEMLGLPSSDRDIYRFGGIDTLNLSVGTVRYSNLRVPKRNQVIQLGLRNELMHNVQSEEDFAGVLFKVLLRAGIPFYTDSRMPSHSPQRAQAAHR